MATLIGKFLPAAMLLLLFARIKDVAGILCALDFAAGIGNGGALEDLRVRVTVTSNIFVRSCGVPGSPPSGTLTAPLVAGSPAPGAPKAFPNPLDCCCEQPTPPPGLILPPQNQLVFRYAMASISPGNVSLPDGTFISPATAISSLIHAVVTTKITSVALQSEGLFSENNGCNPCFNVTAAQTLQGQTLAAYVAPYATSICSDTATTARIINAAPDLTSVSYCPLKNNILSVCGTVQSVVPAAPVFPGAASTAPRNTLPPGSRLCYTMAQPGALPTGDFLLAVSAPPVSVGATPAPTYTTTPSPMAPPSGY